jgi:hypothetical protein
LTVREGECDLPSFVDNFIDDCGLGNGGTTSSIGCRLGGGVEIHFDVLPSAHRPATIAHLFEVLDLESLPIHKHLDISDGTGDIVNSLHHKSISIVIDTAHTESL